MAKPMLKETPEGVVLPVKITPKSGRNQIVGWEGNELKIKIAAIPEDGAANKELIAYLARVLGVSKSNIQLVAGQSSRHKRLIIRTISSGTLLELIQKLL